MLPQRVLQVYRYGVNVVPQGSKVPLIRWKQWQTERQSLKRLKQLATKFPDAQWAIVCGGVGGIIVLDFDGPAGVRTMRRMRLRPVIRTPGGGFHVWVKAPTWELIGGPKLAPEQFPGMDLKCDGHLATFYGPGYSVV